METKCKYAINDKCFNHEIIKATMGNTKKAKERGLPLWLIKCNDCNFKELKNGNK